MSEEEIKQLETRHSKNLLTAIEERNVIIDTLKAEYSKQLSDCKTLSANHLQEIGSLQAQISDMQTLASRKDIEFQIR